jgi:hypothetical protein
LQSRNTWYRTRAFAAVRLESLVAVGEEHQALCPPSAPRHRGLIPALRQRRDLAGEPFAIDIVEVAADP